MCLYKELTLEDCKRKVSAFVDMAMVWEDELVEGNWQSFAFLQSIAENVRNNLWTL